MTFSHLLTPSHTFSGLISLACVLLVVYVFIQKEVFEPFVGLTTIIVALIIAAALLLFSLASISALLMKRTCMLNVCAYLMYLLCLLQVLGTLLIVYWVYSLGGIPTDALTAGVKPP